MLPRYYFLALLLVLAACSNSESPPSAPSQSTSSPQVHHTPIKATAFQQVRGDSLQKVLIERFCEESKGYQENTWLGLNQCIWAIEKYRLAQYPELLQRQADTLIIPLVNGSTKRYIHRGLQTETPTYFRFQRYLPQNGLVLLERIDNQQCTQQVLLRLADGQETRLTGWPYFPKNERFFILNGGTEDCRSTLEYWHLQEGQATQKWTQPLTTGPLQEVRWIDDQRFVAQSAQGFAQFELR